MSPLLASEFLSTEQAVILIFVLFVLPGVSLISLIANWLIRRCWVASLIGPLVCLAVFVWLAHQQKAAWKQAMGRAVNSAVISKEEAKRDDEFVQFITLLVLLSFLPSFGVGVVFSLVRRKRNIISRSPESGETKNPVSP